MTDRSAQSAKSSELRSSVRICQLLSWPAGTFRDRTWYRAAARVAVAQLPPDHLRRWSEPLPDTFAVASFPQAIADAAGTLLAHKVVALHLLALRFSERVAVVEAKGAETAESLAELEHHLREEQRQFAVQLQAMNAALANVHLTSLLTPHSQVLFPGNPSDPLSLAVIPADAIVPPAAIA